MPGQTKLFNDEQKCDEQLVTGGYMSAVDVDTCVSTTCSDYHSYSYTDNIAASAVYPTTVQYSEMCLSPGQEVSEWKCYLFGATDEFGIVYIPLKKNVPNWLIRWFSKILLGCKWTKEDETDG